MMKTFVRWFVTRPILILPLLFAGIGFFAFHLPKLKTDFGMIHAQHGPNQELYEEMHATFGPNISTVVVKSVEQSVLTKECLLLLHELTSKIEQIDGVERVYSLSTVQAIQGGKGFVRVEPLVMPSALSDDELLRIQEHVEQNTLWRNDLISPDGGSALIRVYASSTSLSSQRKIAEAIETLLASHDRPLNISLRHIVDPRLRNTLSAALSRTLWIFLPVIVLIVCAILFLAYRNIASVVLPLFSISASMLTTLGFIAFMEYSLNSVTLIVLPLLLSLSCAESGRILLTYFDEAEENATKKDQIAATLRKDGFPFVITSLALALALLIFTLSGNEMLRQFGIIAAFGVSMNCLLTLFLLPGIGHYLPFATESRKPLQLFLMTLESWLVSVYERYRIVTVSVLFALVVLAIAGIASLRIEPAQWNDTDSAQSGHMAAFRILVDGGRHNRITEPEVLRQIEALQRFLAGQAWCRSTSSFADYMKSVQREMSGGSEELATIPGSRELVSQYLLLLGAVDLQRYVDTEYSKAVIVAYHQIENERELIAAVNSIYDYARASLSGDVTVRVAGYEIWRREILHVITHGLFRSLALVLCGLFVLLAILFISCKVSVVALLPAFLALVFHFGLMGWLNIPLYEGSVMLAVSVLCIVVSNIIHFLVRYRERLMMLNDQNQAIGTTIYHEGEPMLFASLGLGVGFGLMIFSGTPLAMHLGVLSASSMLSALVCVFFISPLLLDLVQVITVWDFVEFDVQKSMAQKSPIFQQLRSSHIKRVILLGSLHRLSSGEYLMRQGESGREMFLLITGQLEVFVEEDGQLRPISILEPGTTVGEMALFGDNIRSAHVRAVDDVKLLRIDEKTLARVKRSYPKISAQVFSNISAILSERLHEQLAHGRTDT